MPSANGITRIAATMGASLLMNGCLFFGSSHGSADSTPGPEGPVARTAGEAWPDRPSDVPVMTPEDILRACVAYVSCGSTGADGGASKPFGADMCVASIVFSGERATPLGDVNLRGNERAEFFVNCVLGASSCTDIAKCLTDRSDDIECQEDGCRGKIPGWSVTCSGTVATVTGDGVHFTRDCATAFAACSPDSSTGCTDRPFTQCAPGTGSADRCDGNIRLGCDRSGQVSYHDCERLGGTCGATSTGAMGCVYPASPECPPGHPQFDSCTGTNLNVCVAGRRVTASAPALCPGP